MNILSTRMGVPEETRRTGRFPADTQTDGRFWTFSSSGSKWNRSRMRPNDALSTVKLIYSLARWLAGQLSVWLSRGLADLQLERLNDSLQH